MLCRGEKALASEPGFATESLGSPGAWLLRLSPDYGLCLPGDGEEQTLDFKFRQGWSWPLLWCVATSLTPSSWAADQPHGVVRQRK